MVKRISVLILVLATLHVCKAQRASDYIECAKAGNVLCQYNLAICYDQGLGTSRDFKRLPIGMKKLQNREMLSHRKILELCIIQAKAWHAT